MLIIILLKRSLVNTIFFPEPKVALTKELKSDNLQYNTLVDQASDVPSIIFFHNFLQNSLQKWFQFILFLFTKIKIKNFECPKSIRNYEKK